MIGLYAKYYAPYMAGGSYLGKLRNFDSYSHTIDATGGFISASLDTTLPKPAAEDWVEHGLGRIIQIKDHLTNKVFRGIVGAATYNIGADAEMRGPLFDIANRTFSIYTPRDFSVYPPVDGSTTETTIVEDTASQALFGIIEKMVNASTTTEENAEKVRDTFLLENSYPKTTGDLSTDRGAGGLSINIEIVGNYSWFKAFIYNNLTPAVITIYDKLVAIIAAEPNNIISTDVLNMQDNVYAVEQLETENRFAWDIIAEMLTLGNDVDDRKRSFGVYDDDKVSYRVAPSIQKYLYKIGDPRVCIKDYISGVVVMPWMVRPGDWIYVPDWLLGRKLYSPTALNQDPRNKYIETVTYTAPWTVSISGSPMDNLSRMLSKITYTGGIY